MKVLITGSSGFMGGYLVEELLNAGHEVVGVDNLSKYGETVRSYDGHARYKFVRGDCKDIGLLKELVRGCDQLIAMAAMIGGISYFHKFAYDLLAENERILAATFDAAIWAYRESTLKRVVVASSSMVFESTTSYPSREGDQLKCPPPQSTYGFQKLACRILRERRVRAVRPALHDHQAVQTASESARSARWRMRPSSAATSSSR